MLEIVAFPYYGFDMRYPFLSSLVLAALTLSACGDGGGEPIRLRLATTTSTESSGLLAYLLPPFEEQENIRVERIAVGTGAALTLGRNGDADLLLVHDRPREDAFIAEGHGVDRRDLMWNDFVILGPPEDPAGVAGLQDAAAALEKIAEAKALFVSRGDDSGTHTREQSLWEEAGGRPSWDEYLAAGQGMGPCLRMANEKQAYVLSDRGSYLTYDKHIDLVVHVERDPGLRNPYGAMIVNSERHPHVQHEAATKLLDYLISPEGQQRIGDFRVEGEVLFHPYTEK